MTDSQPPVEQSARAVVMIRPSRFFSNPETALDNAFQHSVGTETEQLAAAAREEFDQAVATLRAAGVTVELFEDTPAPAKPDAVFPNNWFSTHEDGRIALYPMYSPSRRLERRPDIVEALRARYHVTEVIDYSSFEERGQFLEGTGSMVLDHPNRIAYVSLSRRAAVEPLAKFCADFGYEPVTFTSMSEDGRPIYHTNVIMCIGTRYVLVGLETIKDETERDHVRGRLEESGREIVPLTPDQIANFAGNALELQGKTRPLLVLSSRALAHLEAGQMATIAKFAQLVPLDMPTIELAGGSARCTMATIHLPPKQD